MDQRNHVRATPRRGAIPVLLLCLLGSAAFGGPAARAVSAMGRTDGLSPSEPEGAVALPDLTESLQAQSPPRTAQQVVRAEGDELSDGLQVQALGALDGLAEAKRSPDGLLGLAMLRYGQGDYGGAAEAADAVLEQVSSGPLAVAAATVAGYSLFHRSTLHRELLDESLERMDRALELSDGAAELAAYGKVLVLWAQDRPGVAIREAEGVITAAPSSPSSERARRLLCTIQGSTPAEDLAADGVSVEELMRPTTEQQAFLKAHPDAIDPPEKIYSPAPQYAEEARLARVQGTVVLQAVIDRHGCPTSIKVVDGLPHGLDQKALETVRTWVFRPAMVKDEPVPVYYRLNVNFKLQ